MVGKKLLLFFLGISLILTSCSDKKGDLKNAIPADANYVVCVDSKSLVSKSEYDIFSNSTVQQFISMYKTSLKDESAVKLLDAFLKDANSLGLDLKGGMYFYTNYKVYGIVLGVNDTDKVKEALVKLSNVKEEDIKKEGDVYTIASEPQACVSWDGHKLLLLVNIASAYGRGENAANAPNLAELAKAQLAQGADKSINSNPAFTEFLKKKGDISVFFSMKGLDKSLTDLSGLVGATESTISFKKIFADIEGLSTGMYTFFEKGEVKFESAYFFDSPESEKKFKDLVAQLSGEIKGDQLKYITSEPLFLASANIKGDGVFSYLEKLGFMDLLKKELPDSIKAVDAQNLLKNLNGDITLALNPPVASNENMGSSAPKIALFADVANPTLVIDFIKGKLASEEQMYTELTPTNFKITTDDSLAVYWGTNANMFFFTNDQSVYDNLSKTDLTNNYMAVIKDKSGVMLGDLQALQPYIANNPSYQAFGPFLTEFGKYEFTSTSDLAGSGKLELKTKDKNSLAVICKQLDQLISNLGGMFR